MAKDKNGKTINVGDTITVTARVVTVLDNEEAPNLSAITVTPFGPNALTFGVPVLHGSQVELVDPAPAEPAQQ